MELRTLQHKKLEGFEFRSLNQPLQKKKSHEVHVISHHKSRENDTRYFRLSFTCNARCFHFHIGFVHFHRFFFFFFFYTRVVSFYIIHLFRCEFFHVFKNFSDVIHLFSLYCCCLSFLHISDEISFSQM